MRGLMFIKNGNTTSVDTELCRLVDESVTLVLSMDYFSPF